MRTIEEITMNSFENEILEILRAESIHGNALNFEEVVGRLYCRRHPSEETPLPMAILVTLARITFKDEGITSISQTLTDHPQIKGKVIMEYGKEVPYFWVDIPEQE